MYCCYCGHHLPDDVNICSICGRNKLLNVHAIRNKGKIKITVQQSEIWFAYIDECYDIEEKRLIFNETWEGLEDQIIGIYPTEKEMAESIRLFYKQGQRWDCF